MLSQNPEEWGEEFENKGLEYAKSVMESLPSLKQLPRDDYSLLL